MKEKDIEEMVSISDGDIKWLKICEAGFMDGNDFLTEDLSGQILQFKPYWIKWIAGQRPQKVPFTNLDDCPEGFELRTDLTISLCDGELVGLSLAPSSAHAFSRYMRRVLTARLIPSEIVTTMKTRAVTNSAGQKFTILDFAFNSENSRLQVVKKEVKEIENPPEPAECRDWETESEKETDVPLFDSF